MALHYMKSETGTKYFLLIISLFFFFVTLFSLSPLTVSTALAADITLEWDPNSEPDIAGYKVYYGLQSGYYTNTIDVGNYTTCVISGLDSAKTYYFAATAYNTDGYESNYSNEVSNSDSDSSLPTPSASGGGGGGGGGCFIATAAYGNSGENDVVADGHSGIGGFLLTLWQKIR